MFIFFLGYANNSWIPKWAFQMGWTQCQAQTKTHRTLDSFIYFYIRSHHVLWLTETRLTSACLSFLSAGIKSVATIPSPAWLLSTAFHFPRMSSASPNRNGSFWLCVVKEEFVLPAGLPFQWQNSVPCSKNKDSVDGVCSQGPRRLAEPTQR